jgi:predicted ATPase
VLATSRSPLHLQGERLYALAPLAVPQGPVPGKPLDPASLGRVSSVALFVQRAGAVDSSFELSTHNAQAVAAICTRLDGLPLAIELAAARSRLFTPEQLLSKLERRFALLSQGLQDSPERHRSLSAVLDWSHQLLSNQAQALFAAISVFRGGATLEAIRAVCMPEGGRAEGCESEGRESEDSALEDLLDTLLDHSLVLRMHGSDANTESTNTGSTTSNAEAHRFTMLETVQAYAQQRLKDSGLAHAVQHRHASHFTEWAESIEPRLRGPQRVKLLESLEGDHDNLRTALRWGAGNDPAMAYQLCASMSEFWSVRGHAQEGRSLLDLVLALASSPPLELRSKCMFAVARLALLQGDFQCAEVSLEHAAGLSRQVADLMGTARALNGLGLVAMGKGNYQKVIQFLEESRDLATQANEPRFVSMVAANLGMAKCNLGDYESGRRLLRESLAFQRQIGDDNTVCHCLTTLADLAHIVGDYTEAAICQDEVLALGRRVGNQRHVSAALLGHGELAADLCDFDASIKWLDEGLALSRLLGDRYMMAHVLSCRGKVAISQREPLLAQSLLLESYALFRETTAENGLDDCLSRLVRCCLLQGDVAQAHHFLAELIAMRDNVSGHARAAMIETASSFFLAAGDAAFATRLLGTAAALRARGSTPLCPADRADHEHVEIETRARLGEQRCLSLHAQGERTSADVLLDELNARVSSPVNAELSVASESQQRVALSH